MEYCIAQELAVRIVATTVASVFADNAVSVIRTNLRLKLFFVPILKCKFPLYFENLRQIIFCHLTNKHGLLLIPQRHVVPTSYLTTHTFNFSKYEGWM